MRSALAACSLVLLTSLGGRAEAQPDAQLRWPSLAPDGLLLVRGAGVVPHLETAVGLDVELLRDPIVLIDRAVDVEHAAVETRVTSTLLYAVGLFDHSQVTVSLPAVWQEGEGRSALTREPGDALPAGAAGDLRLEFQHALPARWVGPELALALSSGLVIPTGDEVAFAGEAGLAGWLEVAAQGAIALGPIVRLRLGATLGVRGRETARVGDAEVGTELPLAAALGVELFDARLVLAAEVLGVVGLAQDASIPVLALGEARVTLGRERRAEIALGAGAGIDQALRTPSFQGVIALRYIPQADRANPPRP